MVYHVLNRANGRETLFRKTADYEAFERVMEQAHARLPTRLLSYCIMPNHWHMVTYPREDGELSEFMRWLSVTHAQRLHAHRHTGGHGHVYQGRFKSFPVQRDEHYLTVCRYVERNALRAGLVKSAENWRWSSLWRFAQGAKENWILSEWPVERPRGWVGVVNRPQNAKEEDAVRRSVMRSSPFGSDAWRERTAEKLGLEWTIRPRGRPRVRPEKGGQKGNSA
jgi:putative transposase